MINASRKTILVIGRTGQAAQALRSVAEEFPSLDLVFAARPDLDLSKLSTIEPFLDKTGTDLILNSAAYTAVDRAEEETEEASRINREAPRILAHWCAQREIPILHMSTDCVFDGTKPSGYVETDSPNPLSVYGRTKAEGEAEVSSGSSKHLIVRVGWVHSQFGKSFPRTMLRLAQSRNEVQVVNDQFGRPTHAVDLARGLLSMAEQSLEPSFSAWGIYHLAGQGALDRASMAQAIFDDSRKLGGPTARVVPVSSDAFGAAAKRPSNARLDSPKVKAVFGLELPYWQGRLTDTVTEILKESSAI